MLCFEITLPHQGNLRILSLDSVPDHDPEDGSRSGVRIMIRIRIKNIRNENVWGELQSVQEELNRDRFP